MFEDLLNDLKLVEESVSDKPVCKGIFFRCTISSFLSSYKSIETRKSLRLLKRKSCTGCEKCEPIWEFLQEDMCDRNIEDYIGDLKSESIYELGLTGGTGYYPEDDWCEVQFTEIK